MKRKIKYFIIIFSFISISLEAQINADFSYVNLFNSWCSPVTISFTDKSTSMPPILTWKWNFGNGNTSTLKNPQAIYNASGSYNVSLIVYNGITYDTTSQILKVNANPKPDFTASKLEGCVPLNVDFTQNITLGDTTLKDISWVFGDGGSTQINNPNYSYSVPGVFSVTLRATDNNGCIGEKTKSNYVSAGITPIIDMAASITDYCKIPVGIQFYNYTSPTTNVTYKWHFGTGDNSTQKAPLYFYENFGNYDVMLVANHYGCIDSLNKKLYIKINPVVPNFTVNKDTACLNEVLSFNNTSTGATNYFWDFGDGNTSNQISPTHSYSSYGNFQVTLYAYFDDICTETVTKTIHIQYVEAKFTVDTNYSCSIPFLVNYIDMSTNATQWNWAFGDKKTSSSQNPSNSFTKAGNFYDTLFVTSKFGCKDFYRYDTGVVVNTPTAFFHPNTFNFSNELSGCIPHTVNFRDKSTYNSTIDNIVSWKWDLGDGTTSTEINPSHTYTVVGGYPIQLEIETQLGCKSMYNKASVLVGTPQTPDFTIDNDTVCAKSFSLTDASVDASKIDTWIWTFSDGGQAAGRYPIYTARDTGFLDVSLIVSSNGCKSSITKPNFVYISGPIGSITKSFISCDTRKKFMFISNWKGATSIYRDYNGDLIYDDSLKFVQPNSSKDTTYYEYLTRGNKTINFLLKNDSTGCSISYPLNLSVYDLDAKFTINKNVSCYNLNAFLNSSSSVDYTYPFRWTFGDGTTLNTNTTIINHLYSNPGQYPIQLALQDYYGCKDTVRDTINIYQPYANFNSDINSGCNPLLVNFTDSSTSDSGIVKWNWQFGDLTSSDLQNPSNTYINRGFYDVKLKITDKFGCEDSITKVGFIRASKPRGIIHVSDSTICIGDTVEFQCDSSINYLYNWTLEGLPNQNENTFKIDYPVSGMFNVQLSIQDVLFNCTVTKNKDDFIIVQDYPKADFTVGSTLESCYPASISINDNSQGNNISVWDWYFSDSTSSINNPNITHTFYTRDTFDVALKVTTTNGCSDSIHYSDLIIITGPFAAFKILEDSVCRFDSATYVVSEMDYVHEFLWDFGDGVVGGTNIDSIKHGYSIAGMVKPRLIYSDIDKICMMTYTDSIYVVPFFADISISDTIACAPFNIDFIDNNIDSRKWIWDFDDGNNSNIKNPSHTYENIGNYKINLYIENNIGCWDTISKNLLIQEMPPLKIISDTTICSGKKINLFAIENGYHRYWMPSEYLNNDTIKNPLATIDSTTTFKFHVDYSENCFRDDSVTVYIQNETFINDITKDTTIKIGDEIYIGAILSQYEDIIYGWTPNYAISCDHCFNPKISPLKDTKYVFMVTDTNNCFTNYGRVNIIVDITKTVDVPKAFSPNNDGVNDKIYVKGLNIYKLHEFKIFNRWGEMVFVTNDLNIGWDGYYKGTLQNQDTYTYLVKSESYDGLISTHKGTILLMR